MMFTQQTFLWCRHFFLFLCYSKIERCALFRLMLKQINDDELAARLLKGPVLLFVLPDLYSVMPEEIQTKVQQIPYQACATAFLPHGSFLDAFQSTFSSESESSATSLSALEAEYTKINDIKRSEIPFSDAQVFADQFVGLRRYSSEIRAKFL